MPVMKLASSDARNTTAFAISSGLPNRPSGTSIRRRRNALCHWAKHEFAEIHSFFPCQITIFFLEAVGSLLRLSVVKEEKGEKPGQNPEHRAENSEPEWNVPG
jgi:hypothetical protein